MPPVQDDQRDGGSNPRDRGYGGRTSNIPKGRYEVQVKMGRTLAISRDGNQWQRVTDGASALGVVEVRDGTFDLWVDDRYAHEPPGSAYYDCLTFIPVPERPDRPQVAGFAKTRVREQLDRGLVARPAGEGRMYLGWRLLESDPKSIGFHIDRQGDGPLERMTREPITKTTDFTEHERPIAGFARRPTATAGRATGPRWPGPTARHNRSSLPAARPCRRSMWGIPGSSTG